MSPDNAPTTPTTPTTPTPAAPPAATPTETPVAPAPSVATPPPVPPKKKGSALKKIFLISGIVLVVLLIGAVIAGFLLTKSNQPVKYTEADIQVDKTASYTISRPNTWVDYSNDADAKKTINDKLGGLGSTISDQRMYGNKYNPKNDSGLDALFAASFSVDAGGLTEAQFRQALNNTEVKQGVEKSFEGIGESFGDKDKCEKVTASKPVITYPESKYVYTVSVSAECTYNAQTKAKQGVDGYHVEAVVKVKHDTGYIAVLLSAANDWALNGDLYKKSVIGTFDAN